MTTKIKSFFRSSKFDASLLILLLWVWTIPGALFWQKVVAYDIVLPLIPHFAWLLPGKFWQMTPFLLIFVLLLFTVLSYIFLGRKFRPSGFLRGTCYILLILIIIIHFVWGGVLLSPNFLNFL